MTEVAKLDQAGLEELIAGAETGRVCARFELDRGRPRTAAGLAAGLVVVALAGCATPVATPQPIESMTIDWDEHSGAAIMGVVTDSDSGRPLANALVILMSTALPHQLERVTNQSGIYAFTDLPPGNYTVQVLIGYANVSKTSALAQDARFRANFRVNPDQDEQVLIGMVIERPLINTTSASSRY